MPRVPYSKFGGLKSQFAPIDTPQLNFLLLENYVPNRKLGGLSKRGGSKSWATTGDVWGIGGYVKKLSASPKVPVLTYPIRHRRSGSTSFVEYLDWANDTWTAITQGAAVSGNLDIGGLSTFAQQDDLLAMFADRPVKITDPTTDDVERLGGPAPASAPTTALITGSATLTGTYRHVYTFYDSTSGWESSPSAASTAVSPSSQDIRVSNLATSCDREGVDKKRIYRTNSSNEEPFLRVAEVTLATTSYDDAIPDASLGTFAPSAGDHDPPPEGSYVGAAFDGRIWIASGSGLSYSNAYDGSNKELEYFNPASRFFDFEQRITALHVFAGRLLVFLPPGFGVRQIRRRSDGVYQDDDYLPGEGTNYAYSVSSNQDMLTYWGGSSAKLITPGGFTELYSDDINNFLRDLVVDEYNENVFICSVWQHDPGQFLYSIAGSSGNSAWAESGTSLVVQWQDSVTGQVVDWAE